MNPPKFLSNPYKKKISTFNQVILLFIFVQLNPRNSVSWFKLKKFTRKISGETTGRRFSEVVIEQFWLAVRLE